MDGLFTRLVKIKKIAYAIRYAIPTVLIFWTFVEIAGRGNWYGEFWVEPLHYWKEVTITGLFLIVLAAFLLWKGRHK